MKLFKMFCASFLLLAALNFSLMSAEASSQSGVEPYWESCRTVEYGANWCYGNDWASNTYSNLYSSSRNHSTTVCEGGHCDNRTAAPGKTAHSSRYDLNGNASVYYDIW